MDEEDDDEDSGYEEYIDRGPIPDFVDATAQQVQSFQYLATALDTVSDLEIKKVGYMMLTAIVEKVGGKGTTRNIGVVKS